MITVRRLALLLSLIGLATAPAFGQISIVDSVGRDGTLTLDLYGFLFGQFVIDANQTGRDPFLNIQPLPGSPGVPSTEPDAFFSVEATRVGLALNYGQEAMNAEGRLEVDFDTPTRAPRIRHAYGKFARGTWSLLAGQTWSVVSQLDPTTINSDNLFNIGNTYERVPQVRFSYGPGVTRSLWELQVGAATFFGAFDQPQAVQVDSAASEAMAIAPNTPPVIQGRLAYGWHAGEQAGHVALGGSLGRVNLRSDSGTEWHTTHALVVAEVLVPVAKDVGLMAEAFYGKAPGFNGGIGQTVVVTAAGAVVPVESWGGFAQLAVQPHARVNVNLVTGIDNPSPSPGGTRLLLGRNVTALGNLFWEVIDHFTAAFEFQYIASVYEQATTEVDNIRSTFAFYVIF
jgi:hypothetical protein